MGKKMKIILSSVLVVVAGAAMVALLWHIAQPKEVEPRPAVVEENLDTSELRERAIEKIKQNDKEGAQEDIKKAITKAEEEEDKEAVVELEQQLDWASMEPEVGETEVDENTNPLLEPIPTKDV